jgi:hypothetical protein
MVVRPRSLTKMEKAAGRAATTMTFRLGLQDIQTLRLGLRDTQTLRHGFRDIQTLRFGLEDTHTLPGGIIMLAVQSSTVVLTGTAADTDRLTDRNCTVRLPRNNDFVRLY